MHIKTVTYCPVKIPKTGKKLFKLSGVELFLREIGGLLYIYDVKTGTQILCGDKKRKTFLLGKVLERIDEVKGLHDRADS